VAQRTQEVGIRMALGATPAAIVRLVARDGGIPVIGGLIAGLFGAVAAGPLIRNLLYGSLLQPGVLASIAAALLATAALAIAIPARRASRTDPMEALRQ
jgi:putative ABC transport system permease protein